MKIVRTVGSVHIVIIPSLTGFQLARILLCMQQLYSFLYSRLILLMSSKHCQNVFNLDILF